MRMIWVLLLPSLALAQSPSNGAIVRGTVLERDANSTGELSIRAADNQVLRYRFDAKTYVERDQQAIQAARLTPGEKVEVLSQSEPPAPLRYAMTIHVLQPVPPPRPQTLGRYRAPSPTAEPVLPSGNITYSGVVSRLDAQRVLIHTRDAGDLSIQLRKDTRFLEDGQAVDAERLKPNMRVFVRAGKDIYQQIEAYQIVWGNILTPK
jgi:hypothetical protein